MKATVRCLALLAALALALMLCGAATAEKRASVVYIEGEPETVVETRFTAESGFSFWYDADVFEVAEVYGGAEVHVYPKDMGDSGTILLNIIPADYAGALPWKWLELNAREGVEYREDATAGGDAVHWFSVVSPYNETKLWSYYAVDGAQSFIVAEGLWPVEADEGWGERFRALLRTVEFAAAEAPVSAQWWDDANLDPDDCEVFTADDLEYAIGVAFTAARPVKDFCVTALLFEGMDGGSPVFSEEVLAQYDALEPGRPLLVWTAFYGDIPNNGIRYTDPETGFTYRYAVAISGEDGSPVLTGF